MTLLAARRDGRLWAKLCGFRDPGLATVAMAEGADAIGVVFHAASPRDCPEAAAAEIVAAVAPLPVVAVVVDRNHDELDRLVGATGVTGVQLCGSETADDVAWLTSTFPDVLVIRSRRVDPAARDWGHLAADGAAAVLVDAAVADVAGGSGMAVRWQQPSADAPVILAGGLAPRNVAAAVAAVAPFGVDVSSGIEVERGRKDAGLIRAFMDAVRDVS